MIIRMKILWIEIVLKEWRTPTHAHQNFHIVFCDNTLPKYIISRKNLTHKNNNNNDNKQTMRELTW